MTRKLLITIGIILVAVLLIVGIVYGISKLSSSNAAAEESPNTGPTIPAENVVQGTATTNINPFATLLGPPTPPASGNNNSGNSGGTTVVASNTGGGAPPPAPSGGGGLPFPPLPIPLPGLGGGGGFPFPLPFFP